MSTINFKSPTDAQLIQFFEFGYFATFNYLVLPDFYQTYYYPTDPVNFSFQWGPGTVVASAIGDDVVIGGLLDDHVDGELGNDTLYGGVGNDRLEGDEHNDQLFGGEGDDSIWGGADDDTIFGHAGNDTLEGSSGVDLIEGDAGNDSIHAGSGDDTVYGGDGNDSLHGSAGNDLLYGGLGEDSILGSGDTDTLYGEDGNDSLNGSGGNDELYGGQGDDLVVGDWSDEAGVNNDSLWGGIGRDTLRGGLGEDTLYGEVDNDRLYGENQIDELFGGDGLDSLFGGAGDDWLVGDDLADTLRGGENIDFLIAGKNAAPKANRFFIDTTDQSADSLFGEAGDDHLFSWSRAAAGDIDTLSGGAGIDTYYVDGEWRSSAAARDTIEQFEVGETLHLLGSYDLAYASMTTSSGQTYLAFLDSSDLKVRLGGVKILSGDVDLERLAYKWGSVGGEEAMSVTNSQAVQTRGVAASQSMALTAREKLCVAKPLIDFIVERVLSKTQVNKFIDDAVSKTMKAPSGADPYVTLFKSLDPDNVSGLLTRDGPTSLKDYIRKVFSEALEAIFGQADRWGIDGSGSLNCPELAEAPMAAEIARILLKPFPLASLIVDFSDAVIRSIATYMFIELDKETQRILDSTPDGRPPSILSPLSLPDGNGKLIINQPLSSLDATDGTAGHDTVVSWLTDSPSPALSLSLSSIAKLVLPGNIEDTFLLGDKAGSVVGNGLANLLAGNAGANSLSGLGGNDTLQGAQGNDTLDGGAGTDRLEGGVGDDTYLLAAAGDTVVETSGAGSDTVRAGFSLTLATHLEKLVLTGTANLNGTGNAAGNHLTGNSGVNLLQGLAGNDRLDGAAGTDTLLGGAGNDTFVVSQSTDRVFETTTTISTADAGGLDTVQSGVNWTLGSFVEHLLLTGTGGLNGAGNGLANRITGNTGGNTLLGFGGNDTILGGGGNDQLDGGTGMDRLEGGAGNDTYVLATSGDTVVEVSSGGTDTVRAGYGYTLGSTIENLVLTGTANLDGLGNGLNNRLTGNDGANTLSGGGGADVLTGGKGLDLLRGGADGSVRDVFVFAHRSHSAVGAGRDTIENLVRGVDDIDLRGIDARAASTATNEAFVWGGTTAGAHKVWWQATAGGVILKADVTGDTTADFEVFGRGVSALGSGDVLL